MMSWFKQSSAISFEMLQRLISAGYKKDEAAKYLTNIVRSSKNPQEIEKLVNALISAKNRIKSQDFPETNKMRDDVDELV